MQRQKEGIGASSELIQVGKVFLIVKVGIELNLDKYVLIFCKMVSFS